MIDHEARLRNALVGLPSSVRLYLLAVLDSPDEERASAIGRLFKRPQTRDVSELLIDLEEDRALQT